MTCVKCKAAPPRPPHDLCPECQTEVNQRVMDNQPLVFVIVRKLYKSSPSVRKLGFDDATQHGQVGLIHAARFYDPELGFTFSTYACQCIIRMVMRKARKEAYIIHVPIETMLAATGAAKGSDATQRKRNKAAKLAMRVVSCDDVGVNANGEPFSSWQSAVVDKHLWDLEGWEDLENALKAVHATDREMVLLRLYHGWKYNDIGKHLGISRERVRQRIDRSLVRIVRAIRLARERRGGK